MLAAARRIPEVKAVATIGAPSDTEHLRDTLVGLAPELETDGEAELRLGGPPVRVRRQLLDDLEEQTMMASIHNLGLPLLIFHSPVDEVVGIDHARRIYKAARHPKSFVSLDGADHLLLAREEDSRFVADVLAAWAGRYVPMTGLPEPLPTGEVLVQGGAAGYANLIQAGPHTLRADEPASVGGADSGPNPYDLLLAGLGACKSMTMRMYADRKGWPLGGDAGPPAPLADPRRGLRRVRDHQGPGRPDRRRGRGRRRSRRRAARAAARDLRALPGAPDAQVRDRHPHPARGLRGGGHDT